MSEMEINQRLLDIWSEREAIIDEMIRLGVFKTLFMPWKLSRLNKRLDELHSRERVLLEIYWLRQQPTKSS